MRRKPLALALRLTALIAPALYAAGALPPVTSSSPEVPRAGQAAEVTSIREVRLTTNDLIVDPNTQTIYASVPADVASGNSIVALNPTAASLGNPVFIGSSPGKMAITTDGQFIYVILNGAGAVRRFDLATQTAGPQFTMGNEPFDGPFFALSLAAAPGNPHLFAVFRLVRAGGFTGNVAVFDEGVRRDSVFALPENSAAVAFGADASKLYSYAPLPRRLARLAVSSAGVAATGTSQLNLPTTTDAIKYVDGRLYTGSGFVLDPEAGTTLGTFPQGGLRPTWPFAVDPTAGRAFYVTSSAQTMTVRAFDLNTFQEVGSIDLPGAAPGEPTGLVRWGSNGLALSTTQGRVFLIQSTLVPSGDPVSTFTPTPTPSPTPSPTPFETQVRRI